ncbi:MAG TPA: type II secretion system minor pseudopilin GspK [Casimicrobiaceae bacterium]|jgi:general secretion pathway protein K
MSRSPARARGAAVIIAMVVAALAATVAIAIAAEQQRWLSSVSARRDQVQAQSLALAGVQWTRAILVDDAAHGPLDYLGEPWALPLPPTPFENGTIEGSIVDAQGLLNVNNLDQPGTQGDVERMRLAQLCARFGVPSAAVGALADWISPGGTAQPNDTDAWYARQPSPYLPARAPLLRTRELAVVRGFDDAAVARLLPYVTALPRGTALNVNTAPAAVLAAALPGIPDDALSALVGERLTRPFTSVADFRSRLPQGIPIGDERAFAVSSSYFVVTVRARQGDAVAQARALLRREPGAWPGVVWQTLE